MRRYGRSAGGTVAHKMAGPIPDAISLIRSFDNENMPTRPVRPSPLTASTIQGLPLDLLDRLRSFPLFVDAPDSFLVAIGTHLRPQLYNPHDYILTEGDDAKAMYWVVRGAVKVTSRDGESTFAHLKAGSFFGEIGILMDIPRTATVIAELKSMVVRLSKEELQKVLPDFPDIERAIREEAMERLAILERKKKERGLSASEGGLKASGINKRPREGADGDVEMGEVGALRDGHVLSSTNSRKRKSPSPALAEHAVSSALGSGSVSVRQLLNNLPLFSSLPAEILHFLGLNAQPRTYPPFTEIVKQGSPGRDVYFIARGEVEVVTEALPSKSSPRQIRSPPHVLARLKPGQYFGEVTSLSLAPRRTATVRSIATAECLMISGDVLNELWNRCSPDLRKQVEKTARQRLEESSKDTDVEMDDTPGGPPDMDELALVDLPTRRRSVPTLTLTDSSEGATRVGDSSLAEPFDPDPYFNVELDNMRSKSRRGSLAPPSPSSLSPSPDTSPDGNEHNKGPIINGHTLSLSLLNSKWESAPEPLVSFKRPKIFGRHSQDGKGLLPDSVLALIMQHLDIVELMKLRLTSHHWNHFISTSPDVLHTLDLTPYNRFITDTTLAKIVCPFVGQRPRVIDISNCFHMTDDGFIALASMCGANVKIWKMKSVWDITGQAVLEMTNRAKGLEEVDLSNCRKVGDNLLARVVGWVVPELPPAQQQQQHSFMNGRTRFAQKQQQLQAQQAQQAQQQHAQQAQGPPPGTVVGCPQLKRLTLSYCKHITDRSMAHIAVHASTRLESMDLTRCTTITDAGFQHWSVYPFPRLRKLILADCTYLTDNAIVYLCGTAKGLKELDLSFCCALSDTATEVLSLGLPALTHLNLAFCGSAVSDASLRAIGLHLLELKELSVRGCVRVTPTGVESVVRGCTGLEVMDVSQCRNLEGWAGQVGGGGAGSGRKVRFVSVADGSWRGGR
ncbi:RNI-like protein [Aulographum hederae CBS 113979]|uniref:RNI-like protein n=1 Tax=Aulographum hederae CBS 113979 TaxID=1176131 RepID=A0A6G1GNW8_9PEZI|nr:RNI-like protein [Aulographum hederae CBS 113979]